MRRRFDEQMEELNNMLIEMGSSIEEAISKACTALLNQDVELANEAILLENDIDEQEREIENFSMRLLTQQQPIARDLRQIHAALKMITDMERIGDHARDISQLTIYIADQRYIDNIEEIPKMAEAAIKMVTESIEAFVRKDTEMARGVIKYDDVIDKLFSDLKTQLFELIKMDVENGAQALDFLMIAKYFERIGDHAVNVAEWVYFSITGEHVKKRHGRG